MTFAGDDGRIGVRYVLVHVLLHARRGGRQLVEVGGGDRRVKVLADVDAVVRRYYTLFTAADMALLVPVIQHDWMAAFRVAWMRPGQRP